MPLLIGAAAPTMTYVSTVSGITGHNLINECGEGYYSPFAGIASVCDYPAVGNVRSGVAFGGGALTGTMTEPVVANVKAGVQYGANGTEFTGTLSGGGGAISGWFG